MMQLMFFAASVLVVFLGHSAFWFLLTRLFTFSLLGEIWLGVAVFFFFCSAFISSYLIHKWDNIFTRWYYILSAFWIGLLVNLGLAMIIVLLGRGLFIIFNFQAPAGLWLNLFFGLGIAFSAWGVFNAWQPVVKGYEVKIKDLPDFWDGKTIVQISDVHLGPVYRRHFFSRVVRRINAIGPEAVFITGDLFDGMEGNFDWLGQPLAEIKAPSGLYYSFGNHDQYLGFKQAKQLLSGSPAIILDNKMVEEKGLQIIGINYSFSKYFDLYGAILRQVGYSQAKPSLLLFHAPKDIDQAKQAEIDLQLSGHTHRGQMFPLNWLAKFSHNGYGYGLFRDGDFNLIVTSGVGSWGPPLRTVGRSEIVKIILRKKK